MPIFSRRRIQAMLDEIRPKLDTPKVRDFLNRLSKSELAVACEMELALLWGIQQVSDLTIEPELSGSSRRPEALSNNLFDKPAYIEVATLSDGDLSGEENMYKATQKIFHYVNTVQKGFGHKLFFVFQESKSFENGVYARNRGIKRGFELDDTLKRKLSVWVKQQSSKTNAGPLHLRNEKIDVIVQVQGSRSKQSPKYTSTVPALAYNVEDNPVYKTLKNKESQLSGAPSKALKIIFLADGGSRLLRLLADKDPQNLHKSGEEIIHHFLSKSSIDAVCVFSPYRKPALYTQQRELIWKVSLICRNGCALPENNLKKLASLLPKPNFEGYQARSLQKQGAFSPLENSWYLGTQAKTGKELRLKISARLLQEFLAGRLTKEQFEQHSSIGDKNMFELWLQQGHALSNISFESAGTDEDDDYVVFEFVKNPAMAPFV